MARLTTAARIRANAEHNVAQAHQMSTWQSWRPDPALDRIHGAHRCRLYRTFLPERCTRYTFRVFTSLFLAGLVLVAADLLGWR